MNSLTRYGLLMVLVLMLIIPGAYGITVDTSSGGATGTVGSATTYKAPSDSEITTSLILGSDSTLSQDTTGKGSLSQTHSASNVYGASVTVGASWSDSKSYIYRYSIYPGEGTGFSSSYVQAGEKLDVVSASDLIAFAEAKNKDGDYAISKVRADYGSISGYANSARADKSSTTTTQSAKQASLAVAPVKTATGLVGGQSIGGKFSAAVLPAGSMVNAVDSNKNAGFFSTASYGNGASYAEWYLQAYDPSGYGKYHDFTAYSDSAKATKSSASISQSVKSASGNWIQWGCRSFNSEGDSSSSLGGFRSCLLSGYSGTETTVRTSASVSQSMTSLGAKGSPGSYGQGFDDASVASNAEKDNAVSKFMSGTQLSSAKGLLNNYAQSTSAKKSRVSTSQKFASASGNEFSAYTAGSNAEKDLAWSNLKITGGQVNTYSDSANADKGSAGTSSNFKSFKGTSVDLASHSQNAQPANEGLSSLVYYGGADFEVQAKKSMAASGVKSTASLIKGVLITPTLPPGIDTAILLEPYKTYAISAGGTDTIETAFPALVKSGYAVIRYVDSAASKDKFTGLNKYNVVMIKSHMNAQIIGLSTSPGLITASELRYGKPPAKSFVIMAGCDSFGGYPTPSKLATAVNKANLRAGYDASVSTAWNQDYMGELFNQMSTGKTATQANDYIWNTYRITWAIEHGVDPNDPAMCKLLFYGNGGFKL